MKSLISNWSRSSNIKEFEHSKEGKILRRKPNQNRNLSASLQLLLHPKSGTAFENKNWQWTKDMVKIFFPENEGVSDFCRLYSLCIFNQHKSYRFHVSLRSLYLEQVNYKKRFLDCPLIHIYRWRKCKSILLTSLTWLQIQINFGNSVLWDRSCGLAVKSLEKRTDDPDIPKESI